MDLVVDWDVAAHRFFEPRHHPATRFLLGPQYVILPPDFEKKPIEERSHRPVTDRVLVCMGGADEHDFTSRVCSVLADADLTIHLQVVVGSGYGFRDALEATLERASFSWEIHQNIRDMFEAYMRCDAAVGAGGLTASELVATRTPAALLATYPHQVARCRYFAEHGWVRYLGYRDFRPTELLDAVRRPLIPGTGPLFDPGEIVQACSELVN
jgi:spore coat polysaccharide biosynthesis predicted glycosyltransferase SpsG